ncbi:MAG: hypothetical protein ACYSUK_01335 [Planctomycetota bacterium]
MRAQGKLPEVRGHKAGDRYQWMVPDYGQVPAFAGIAAQDLVLIGFVFRGWRDVTLL